MDKEAHKKLADDFVELLRTTNRDGIEELIRYLQEETDFFTAPASAKYHGAFESGLLMHSINVCAELNLDPNSKVYPSETIIIVALLHDICTSARRTATERKSGTSRRTARGSRSRSMFSRTSCRWATVKNRCTLQASLSSCRTRKPQLSAGTWEHSIMRSEAATGD